MWPNESDQYRKKRDRLLTAEAELRRQIEAVAELRRSLPQGGQIKEDYTFTDCATENPISVSQLV